MSQQVQRSKSNVKNNFTVTGVETINNSIIFSVAPNPATNDITISFNSEIKEATTITITNILGEVVLSHTVVEGKSATMPLSNLAAGVYLIRIQQGKIFTDKKFIKN